MKQPKSLAKAIKKASKNGTVHLMGTGGNCEYQELDWSVTNRELIQSHAESLGESFNKHGLIRPFIVFPKNDEGKYKLADAHHLYKGMDSSIRPDENVPIFILHWVDPNDEEQTQFYIMLINQFQKTWKTYDFVKSYSKTKGGAYSRLLGAIDMYK